MSNLLVYIAKSSISIAIFYLVFVILFRKEKFFLLNRIYLVGAVIISIIGPLVNQFSFTTNPNITAYTIDPIIINFQQVVSETTRVYSIMDILSILYILGAVFFTFRFLLKLSQVLLLIKKSGIVRINNIKTVILEGNHSPFTFFNILFISSCDIDKENSNELIVHEMIHCKHYHSMDVILIEILTIIQWFNPFVWYIKNSLNTIHEYIADEGVLKEGYSMIDYQKLLFEKTIGIPAFQLTNHFNYSLLKKRIKMMTKKRSNNVYKMKYILVIPLLAVAFAIFMASTSGTIHAQTDEKVYETVEVMPEYPGGQKAIQMFIAKNLKYPEIARDNGIEGTIYIGFVVDKNGKVTEIQRLRGDIHTNDENLVVVVGKKKGETKGTVKKAKKELEEECIRVISLLDDFKPGEQDGKKVKVSYVFPIKFKQ